MSAHRGVGLTAVALLGACSPSSLPPNDTAARTVPVADGWRGRWTGPEGTALTIEGSAEAGYSVTIRNLDGPRRFDGQAVDGGLAIERDGQRLVLRATDGAGTGMKWLADKHDCLLVQPHEGFCRD